MIPYPLEFVNFVQIIAKNIIFKQIFNCKNL